MTKQILVVNDDGITAPGILALISVASKFGEITVVAPDKPQSGMGHAISVNSTIRINPVKIEGTAQAFACSGTPVDCVKMAVNILFKGKKPDLIVSGINHGANHSINVIYSGTMSAAMEGAIENIPSIGFSLLDYSIDADFSASKIYAEKIIKHALQHGIPAYTCLNVNIPKMESEYIKGIKVCRQAMANWEEEFDERIDPTGKPYYWLTGKFINYDNGADTDVWALENNFVSIVPVQPDVTAHNTIRHLKTFENV
ncbi:MAG: 5'/3'-nucleotidase SurE [Bacteroidetes bacterium]|nr:5'/3'-nucleotidase SurE [Bacteroidota bacterium]MBV6460958.1 5'-nucleotidase SurE [Flavobacteriales bacterium]WKZ75643.1 MAG: 5'/3'-nucleotidase SurE [Vicingaceae bacterium]MCL4815209.1 5'/3'-nucleotidase SurE [Flavobacteriales bacterium]NOG94551.1 5'/3'-nucleotidase SurE [Bacteroidota bacterium]